MDIHDRDHHLITPYTVWTSDVSGRRGVVYSFGSHRASIQEKSETHRILCIRPGIQ